LGYTVFYMNPVVSEEVCQIIRKQMPVDWHLTTPGVNGEFHAGLASCDFILVADQAISAEHIAAAPRLRMIQHQGVGYERIDLNACRSRQIPVALTPEGTSAGVAEHTLLLILAVYKNLIKASAAVRVGYWPQWELRSTSFDLQGKSLGLVGMGRIGRAVAQRALAFGAQILYFDPLVPDFDRLSVTRLPSLAVLLAKSDIISLHVPLTPQNQHLINGRTLQMMKPGAILVNTARGGLVDETALAEALISGRIAAAALDVLEQEPPAPDNPLLHLENVLITPHIAAGTRDALITKMQSAFANMVRHTLGQPLANVVPELADLPSAK
jgi:phosphoglycerate dehydrogenase-like enzyme